MLPWLIYVMIVIVGLGLAAVLQVSKALRTRIATYAGKLDFLTEI